jgi:hypothetical protein
MAKILGKAIIRYERLAIMFQAIIIFTWMIMRMRYGI